MKLLVFPLESPLQSWGERSRWDNRDTALMPTKSGIVGLLGCCLGYGRGDIRLSELSRAIRLAVRADRPGQIITDFHTVEGTGGVMYSAERKPRVGGPIIITPRRYLEYALFHVFIEAPEQLLDALEYAMKHPRWTPFLGRKSCPPTKPLIPAICQYASIEEAVNEYPYNGKSGACMYAEIECAPYETPRDSDIIISRPDEVIKANANEYAERRVRRVNVYRRDGANVS